MGLSLFSGHCVLAAAWYIVCHFTFLHVYVTNKVLLTCLLKAVNALGPGVLSVGGSCSTKWLFSRVRKAKTSFIWSQYTNVTLGQTNARTIQITMRDRNAVSRQDQLQQVCSPCYLRRLRRLSSAKIRFWRNRWRRSTARLCICINRIISDARSPAGRRGSTPGPSWMAFLLPASGPG